MKTLLRRLVSTIRFWVALTVLFVVFYYYPALLNTGFDLNLNLIKLIGQIERFGGHAEAFLRFLSAERLFLVGEISFTLWLLPWVLSSIYRRFKK